MADLVAAVFGADADADAGDRTDHRNARVHERQCAAANGGHRGGAVGLHHFAGDADGVGIILRRQHRLDAAFGERAVADFAAARTGDAAGFADGEVREVVVQQEFLLAVAAGVGIKFLHVVAGAERGERDGLRFAAGEQRRAVRARENADFAGNRADDIKCATVEAFAAFQNQFADGFLLDVVKSVFDDEVGDFLRAEFLDELRADFVLNRLARRLRGRVCRA